ncbi:MAG: FAD/NAD(P)-binding oxidoreductase [Candidatus Bathyarchaeota archaeon]
MKKVLIIGGGSGGTILANILARKTSSKELSITVIDSQENHIYQPGLLYVAFGNENPKKLLKKERKLLNKRVNFIVDEATKIDTSQNSVQTKSGQILDYDYLVMATGSRLNPQELPGFEGAHHFYDLESALKLREALKNFKQGKIFLGIGGIPYKCPIAPVEAVCQLEYMLRQKGVRNNIEITFLSPLPRAFSIESISPLIQKTMESQKITITEMFNIESIDPQTKIVNSLEGESFNYDLLIAIPPHRGAKVVEENGLGDRGGWIPTDKNTLKVKNHDNIYAIGDCTDIPTSKAGSTAHYEAKILGENIAALIKDKSIKKYDGKVQCFFDAGKRASIISFNFENPPKPIPLKKYY